MRIPCTRQPTRTCAKMGGHSRPRPTRREQMGAQKLCGKNELSAEIATPGHPPSCTMGALRKVLTEGNEENEDSIWLVNPLLSSFPSVSLSCQAVSDRYPAIPAADRSLQIKSACRARKEFAPLCNPKVFATTVAFLFRSSSISWAET